MAQRASPQRDDEGINMAQQASPQRDRDDEGINMAQEASPQRDDEGINMVQEASPQRDRDEEGINMVQEASPQRDDEGINMAQQASPRRDRNDEGINMAQEASPQRDDAAGIVRNENENDYDYGVLLEHAHRGDLCSMEEFARNFPGAINTPIELGGLTALHVAVQAGNVVMVEKLVDLMTEKAMEIKDDLGTTAFHDVAIGGIVEMARCMLEKNRDLIGIADDDNWLPITYAFHYKRREMINYLLTETTADEREQQSDICRSLFLEFSIKSQMLDLVLKALDNHRPLVAAKYHDGGNALLRMLSQTPGIFPSSGLKLLGYWQRWIYSYLVLKALDNHPGLVKSKDVSGRNSLLRILSTTPGIFPSGGLKLHGCWQRLIYSCIPMPTVASNGIQCQSQPKCVKQMYDLKKIHAYSSQLLDRACEHISQLTHSECETMGLDKDIHNAAEFGIVEVIVKIIKIRPYLLHRAPNMDKRDLIMVSTVNRQEKIFSLWYGIKGNFSRDRKTTAADNEGNRLLHLAGMLSPSSVLTRIPGAALQMQRELQWFKEVEGICSPATKFMRNNKGKTPDQVFSESHEHLLEKGEKWMKKTATSYTVVGALIITITFTTAFTVPGGNMQDIGIPVFLHKKAFTIFMVSDAISLLASTTSVLMFLGILTSCYAEQDFLKSLPTKLIIGLSMLFISITAMMVAFCAALIVTLKGRLELIIPIVVLACIPVTLFMFLQFPLLVDIAKSTYGPGIFDRKMKPWY